VLKGAHVAFLSVEVWDDARLRRSESRVTGDLKDPFSSGRLFKSEGAAWATV